MAQVVWVRIVRHVFDAPLRRSIHAGWPAPNFGHVRGTALGSRVPGGSRQHPRAAPFGGCQPVGFGGLRARRRPACVTGGSGQHPRAAPFGGCPPVGFGGLWRSLVARETGPKTQEQKRDWIFDALGRARWLPRTGAEAKHHLSIDDRKGRGRRMRTRWTRSQRNIFLWHFRRPGAARRGAGC